MIYYILSLVWVSFSFKKQSNIKEGEYMSRQEINNDTGTDLIISSDKYISIGHNGSNIVLKNGEHMIWFDGDDAWNQLFNAIDKAKASLST